MQAHIDGSLHGFRRAAHTLTLQLILTSDGQQFPVATLKGAVFFLPPILPFMNIFQIENPMLAVSDRTVHTQQRQY